MLIQHVLMTRSTRPRDSSEHIEEGLSWLISAQDATPDDGVSKGFALNKGWMPSYVETTGYIIPTMFDCFRFTGTSHYRERALKMARWELSNQLENGAFPGCPEETNERPLVFDTGQVIFGLVRSYDETGEAEYREAAERAGSWLVDAQGRGGSWERHSLNNLPHAYHTRVAWALLELFRISSKKDYLSAAERNLAWALKHHQQNGWFNNNTFDREEKALTHTIAYAARGLLESGVILNKEEYIEAVQKTADKLIGLQNDDGTLPGSFGSRWEANSSFSCLSGNAQVSIIWLRLYQITGNSVYFSAASQAINFLKTTQDLTSRIDGIRGGIKASRPIYRGYLKLFYPNWATKFFIDALLLEEKARKKAR